MIRVTFNSPELWHFLVESRPRPDPLGTLTLVFDVLATHEKGQGLWVGVIWDKEPRVMKYCRADRYDGPAPDHLRVNLDLIDLLTAMPFTGIFTLVENGGAIYLETNDHPSTEPVDTRRVERRGKSVRRRSRSSRRPVEPGAASPAVQ